MLKYFSKYFLACLVALGALTLSINANAATTLPVLSVANSSTTEGDSGIKNMTFTVTMSSKSTSTVTVGCYIGNYIPNGRPLKPASVGSDFIEPQVPFKLNIPAGATSGTFNAQIIGDTDFEPDEVLVVSLVDPINATVAPLGAGLTAIGTIINDDPGPYPAMRIADAGSTDPSGRNVTQHFIVTLSTTFASAITVQYATSDGTINPATAGVDYVAKSGLLTIPAGETEGEIDVVVKGDDLIEKDETFFVNLSHATNAVLVDARGTGTIVNDDRVPDDASPGASISTPIQDQAFKINTLGSITGSATDDHGVAQVLIRLSCNHGGTIKYWNGSSFTTGTPQVLATLASPGSISTTWSYTFTPVMKAALQSGVYGVFVNAVDTVGNPSATVTRKFTLDAAAPVVAIATPTQNQNLSINAFGGFAGSVTDDMAVSQVVIKFSRVRGGVTQTWNGTNFSATPTLLPVTLASPGSTNTTWTYAISPELKAALDSGAYSVLAYGRDSYGNQSGGTSRAFMLTAAPVLSGSANSF